MAVGQSSGEQAKRWRRGTERNCTVCRKVRALLIETGLQRREFIRYMGFGLQLDKCVRCYAGATRQMLVRGLVEQWAARGLDSDVLRAICVDVFGLGVW